MRFYSSGTDLQLNSELPTTALIFIRLTGAVALLYGTRALLSEIPPQDHVAIALLLCVLLLMLWASLVQIQVTFSLSHNRCWLQRHYLGCTTRQSLPLSQIHSARVEQCATTSTGRQPEARIVLVTSLGMIPVSDRYFHDCSSTQKACDTINKFLASQTDFLSA